jgi:hypothetical protein
MYVELGGGLNNGVMQRRNAWQCSGVVLSVGVEGVENGDLPVSVQCLPRLPRQTELP